MAGYFIFYDVKNNIAVRASNKDAADKVKELNPNIKPIIEISGWQCSINKFDDTNSMNSVQYTKWFKDLNNEHGFQHMSKAWITVNGKKEVCTVLDNSFPNKHQVSLFSGRGKDKDYTRYDVDVKQLWHTDPTGERNWYPGQRVFWKGTSVYIFDVNEFDPLVFEVIDMETNERNLVPAKELYETRLG